MNSDIRKIDSDLIIDITKIAIYFIDQGFKEYNQWENKMIEAIGDSFKPHLKLIWGEANKVINNRKLILRNEKYELIKKFKYHYYYLLTLPFTFFVLIFSLKDAEIGHILVGSLFFNIFVALSFWIYFKKVRPFLISSKTDALLEKETLTSKVKQFGHILELQNTLKSIDKSLENIKDSLDNIEIQLMATNELIRSHHEK